MNLAMSSHKGTDLADGFSRQTLSHANSGMPRFSKKAKELIKQYSLSESNFFKSGLVRAKDVAHKAGISTASMALVWGGYVFIPATLAVAVLAAFVLGKVEKSHIAVYGVWIISTFAITSYFSARFQKTQLSSPLIEKMSLF